MKYKLALVLILIFLFGGCRQPLEERKISDTGFYFDTVVTVTLYGTEDEELLERCFELCEYYEGVFSKTIEGSEVWRMNEMAGEMVEVSEEMEMLLEKVVEYCEVTSGAYDPTVAPLTELWDFSEGVVPDQEVIDERLAFVDWTGIQVGAGKAGLLDERAEIDLGGIAKGYIGDLLKVYLLENGVESGIINLGGDILTLGTKPDGSLWTIGLQYPFEDTNEVIGTVYAEDCAVVTSGVYERYFMEDGKIYHHLLDPATGKPADNGLYSVTVRAADAATADALSTGCFVLGLEEGMALIKSLPDTEAVFITEDYELHISSGLKTN